MNQMCQGFDILGIDSLWKDLSYGTKTFDLNVTLILNFDLVLKNFNLGYIFWTKFVKALIHEI